MGFMKFSPRKVTLGTFQATPRIRELISQVLDSGWVSYGEMSLEFEKSFAALHQRKFAILSNSGTSSLLVALQSLKELYGWPDGSKVFVPATTFVATANIVLHNRMVPIFVDIEDVTYNMDPVKLEEAIIEHAADAKAIIPVHLFGQMADMTHIAFLADKYGLKMIEDSCETMFVGHYGRPCGSWGDIGCFSTYNAHLITTGVGGLAITDNPDLASKMRSLVNHGLGIQHLNPGENYAPQPSPNRQFSFESIGHSFRITEFEAAIGVAQLESCWSMLKIRQRNAKDITASLKILNAWGGDFFLAPQVLEGNGHAWMMYPIISLKIPKERVVDRLADALIETRDMMPLLNQPAYKSIGWDKFPVSRWVYDQGFYIGCHQDISPGDIKYIAQTFTDLVDGYLHEEYSHYENSAITNA